MDTIHPDPDACQGIQKDHEDMIALYNEIDTIAKEADSYHAQLNEKFKGLPPLRKKISIIKAQIPNFER